MQRGLGCTRPSSCVLLRTPSLMMRFCLFIFQRWFLNTDIKIALIYLCIYLLMCTPQSPCGGLRVEVRGRPRGHCSFLSLCTAFSQTQFSRAGSSTSTCLVTLPAQSWAPFASNWSQVFSRKIQGLLQLRLLHVHGQWCP